MRVALRYLCVTILVSIAVIYLIGAVVKHGLVFIVFMAMLVGAIAGAALL